MRVLFCSDPLRRSHVDPDGSGERDAALVAGFEVGLVDDDAVRAGDLHQAVRRAGGEGRAIYRAWMLTADQYGDLHRGLADDSIHLLTDPAAYAATHHLPASFDRIADHSPASTWFAHGAGQPLDPVALAAALAAVGPGAVIVKDWVKSRKHEWEEACFIPDATDAAQAAAVVQRFVDRQGTDLVGGVVVRHHVDLELVGSHPRSGTPLAREWHVLGPGRLGGGGALLARGPARHRPTGR